MADKKATQQRKRRHSSTRKKTATKLDRLLALFTLTAIEGKNMSKSTRIVTKYPCRSGGVCFH